MGLKPQSKRSSAGFFEENIYKKDFGEGNQKF
jgi:hypothetical protein